MSGLRVFPLGGLGEVGMNCLALEQDGQVMLVDCGVTFDARGLGIDVVFPDFSALEAYRDRIAGVFVTHGHEDHIGALPYLLKRFDVPVWAPPYAAGLIRERLAEHDMADHVRITHTTPRESYKVGPFEVEPIRVTHSIADATALAIRTSAGMVIHTGDFKFDSSPPDGEAFDIDRLDELGEEGVALLFSDSTNIDASGSTGSERQVGDLLHQIVARAEGAVIVAMFASNVHRLRMLGEVARHTRRRIVLLGRSVATHSRVARATGYLDWPSDLVFPAERAKELPRANVLALASGTQAESRGALARLARGDHNNFALDPSDTIILSSRTIPGNEPMVYRMMGDLLRRGVKLRSWVTDRGIHVSGHAHRSEQKRMLELVRPKNFVPVHGTLHHLTRHAELARETGVANTCILENGDVGTLDEGGFTKTGRVNVGRDYAFHGRALPHQVLRERTSLASEGLVVATLVAKADGIDLRIASRGVLDEARDKNLLGAMKREAIAAYAEAKARGVTAAALEEPVRLALRRVLFQELGFKPTTLVTVVETS